MSHLSSIHRIVPNIYSDNLEKSKRFYTGFLEMDLAMDMKWIMTFASKSNSAIQLSILKNEVEKILDNSAIFISIEVADVDEVYSRAKEQGVQIVYSITNEPWEVRRFFIKDPNGATLNILSHL